MASIYCARQTHCFRLKGCNIFSSASVMPPRNSLARSWTCLIACLLMIVVYGCDEQCYKPSVETDNSQVDENDAIVDGVCYSSCTLNVSVIVTILAVAIRRYAHWQTFNSYSCMANSHSLYGYLKD